ncbi:hypothetical protein NEH16_07075 [Streptomyces drozdowiczii]|uniref:Uncharacterized protein n=1 Tax=Streptomyces drozdowiczii TaxID=202862 RepID=A0ABY6Q348_9ACTN|nr:hypothetical protein [Streptomyces drozdowiczii]UZK58416.1 hypothetical protein NEH16_07075 [Streptomyces drozdowiczii]
MFHCLRTLARHSDPVVDPITVLWEAQHQGLITPSLPPADLQGMLSGPAAALCTGPNARCAGPCLPAPTPRDSTYSPTPRTTRTPSTSSSPAAVAPWPTSKPSTPAGSGPPTPRRPQHPAPRQQPHRERAPRHLSSDPLPLRGGTR